MYVYMYHICVYTHRYSKVSLNGPTRGPTLNGPFRKEVSLGVRISLQWYYMGDRLGPK